jgi:hypothetical protein
MGTRLEISRNDVTLDFDAYGAARKEKRAAIGAIKANRRISVGPYATFFFENFDTMLHQIQEMLYVERGGEEQVAGELSAYNPLIPKGHELVATVMFAIEDPVKRAHELGRLSHVEETITLEIGTEVIKAVAEKDLERTKESGKTSSIHFLHFPFSPGQIKAFCDDNARVVLSIAHDHYGHMAVLPENVRKALVEDFSKD